MTIDCVFPHFMCYDQFCDACKENCLFNENHKGVYSLLRHTVNKNVKLRDCLSNVKGHNLKYNIYVHFVPFDIR